MSLKPHLHAFGTEEGRVTGLGFSGYVSSLIIQDLRSRGDAGKISRLFSPAESPARPHPLPSVADVRRRLKSILAVSHATPAEPRGSR